MPNPGQELSSIDFESMIGGPLVAVVNAQAQAAMSTVNFIKEVGFKKPAGEQDPTKSEVNEPVTVVFKYQKETSPYQPKVGTGSGAVTKITITDGGSGYVAAPTVTISAPPANGTTATATVTVDAQGAVSTITLGAAGTGYTSPPSVTIAPPTAAGGRQATAVAAADTIEVPAQLTTMQIEVPLLTMVPVPFIRIEQATVDFNAKINAVEYRKTDTTIKVDAELEAKAGWLWGSARLKVNASFQRSTSEGVNVERTYSMAVHVRAVQEEMPAGLERILGILEEGIRGQPVKALSPVVN